MKIREKTNPLYAKTVNSLYAKTIDPNIEPWLTIEELYYEFIALQNGINTMMEES